MSFLFTKQNQKLPDIYRYDFQPRVRQRLLLTFRHYAKRAFSDESRYLLDEVASLLQREYGHLDDSQVDTVSYTERPALLTHLQHCNDGKVVDFILAGFRASSYYGKQEGVNEINRIMREEGIGYEFTEYIERPGRDFDKPYKTFPKVIKKDNEITHREIVRPCLAVLEHSDFRAANEHFTKAFDHYRQADYRACIFECESAYETVIKTICQKKRWDYRPDRDTLRPLLEACKNGELAYEFYFDLGVLQSPGHIRNRLGGHGQEPQGGHPPEGHHAAHMIHVTSSHILFMTRCAGMT
jgi:hypothetical protein